MNLSILNSVPLAAQAKRILLSRFYEAFPHSLENAKTFIVSFETREAGGYGLYVKNGHIIISAGSVSEFIAGAGTLLNLIRMSVVNKTALSEMHIEDVPEFSIRTHYMPAHFGNSFEAAWPNEMKRYLEDAVLAGANGYGDWFDPNDMPDPYSPHVYCSKSMSLWEKKKENLRTAKTLGMGTMLVVTHNVAFTDQLRPEWLGKRSRRLRVQGQVLCPSNPAARSVCLKNHDNLFKDLLASGVLLDRIALCPYDDGGCACEKCQPYYPVFLSMAVEILAIAQKYFPAIRLDIIGWWTSEEEMGLLRNFIRSIGEEVFGHFQFNPPYSRSHDIPGNIREFTGDIPLSTFVHIGYSDTREDVYNRYGVHSAPDRLKSLISTFRNVDCSGLNTYNEGFGDHLNMHLSSRLARNPETSVREIILDYCAAMFGCLKEPMESIASILGEMQYSDFSKAGEWYAKLDGLKALIKTPPRQSWAFDHIIIKARLMELDYRIGNRIDWKTPADIGPAMNLIEERLELSELLWRDVYGLGVLSHAFIPGRMYPEWYGKYASIMEKDKSLIVPGSVIGKDV
ncbi:MAG: hypothetical protein JXB33_01980 [Clostridia bacterium]|nr:hypothetical protein [Clostridia bacterium]